MKSQTVMFTLAVLLLTLSQVSAEVILASGSDAVVSSGTLTISTYPYGVNFPVSDARWIWNENWRSSPANEVLTFFSPFRVICFCKTLTLHITADNLFNVYINGKLLTTGDNWQRVYSVEIPSSYLYEGGNTLELVATNLGGPAAVIYAIEQ